MKLSVVIPVFNELDTLGRAIASATAVLPDTEKEILIVDDGSTDGTREWLARQVGESAVQCHGLGYDAEHRSLDLATATTPTQTTITLVPLYHTRNGGKGAAVRTGLAAVTGDVVVIHDADLEYDPADWERMLPLISERGVADVVYGSRFYGQPHRALYFHHYLGNRLISFLFNLLYDQTLTDLEVCYKMFTREVLDSLALTADDFGIEIELSAQVARPKCWRIYEIGISYYGRTYAEGKKISWRDGVKALWYLVKYRVAPLSSPSRA